MQHLAELKTLVEKHRWRINNLRTNLAHSPDDVILDGKLRRLRKGVYSNSVREGDTPQGDRMLEIVREMLHANINALQLNRDVVCGRHKDGKNSAAESYILFFGKYNGGALVFENGERFEEKEVWHGPLRTRDLAHWNEETFPVDGKGRKYAVVAYYSEAQRLRLHAPKQCPILNGNP